MALLLLLWLLLGSLGTGEWRDCSSLDVSLARGLGSGLGSALLVALEDVEASERRWVVSSVGARASASDARMESTAAEEVPSRSMDEEGACSDADEELSRGPPAPAGEGAGESAGDGPAEEESAFEWSNAIRVRGDSCAGGGQQARTRNGKRGEHRPTADSYVSSADPSSPLSRACVSVSHRTSGGTGDELHSRPGGRDDRGGASDDDDDGPGALAALAAAAALSLSTSPRRLASWLSFRW